jgi:hypothetical protein
LPHLEPAGTPVLDDAHSQVSRLDGDSEAVRSPSTGVVTHHWVNDAEWGDIEEIVVYGDAA